MGKGADHVSGDFGIDVSSFNTITDWSAVKGAGNSWAWAKATQADGYVNPLFASQMASGRAAGLAMGAYHFPDPRVSVATNAQHFVAVAGAQGAFQPGSFVPMLDMENSPGDGITWSAQGANAFIPAFRDALRSATGQQLLCVYGSESWFANGFLTPATWADSGVVLCAAQYTGQPGQLGWSHPRLAIHQYTDNAPTPGATGVTDRSVTVGGWGLADLTIGEDFLMALADWQQQRIFDRVLSMSQGVEGENFDGDQFKREEGERQQILTALNGLVTQVTAIQGALTQQETDLLAAIKAEPVASVDAAAVAKALSDAGLPQQVVSALLAVLSKAAAA